MRLDHLLSTENSFGARVAPFVGMVSHAGRVGRLPSLAGVEMIEGVGPFPAGDGRVGGMACFWVPGPPPQAWLPGAGPFVPMLVVLAVCPGGWRVVAGGLRTG